MKSIKRKLTLSALALACCLSAGVINMQSTTADDTQTTTVTTNEGLIMLNGASVYLGDNFSGIRWTTTVTDDLYETISGKTNGAFGIIVAPTASIKGELSLDTPDIINISVGKELNKVNGVYTYYAAVDFNEIVAQYESENGDLTEEQEAALLTQAYEMELTARAYVTSGTKTHYADLTGIETSRSAKQVAIAAELAGEIDKKYRYDNAIPNDTAKAEKAASYYGATNDTGLKGTKPSTGAAGTDFISAEAETTYTSVAGYTLTGDVKEVYVGIEKLADTAYTYENDTLTFTDRASLPIGETHATVFTTAGAQAKPLIVATKVLDSTDDLSMFQAKGGKYDASTKGSKWTDGKADASQIYEGYYVLGKDIEADGYVHGSKNSTTEICQYEVTVTVDEETTQEDKNGDGEIKNYKTTETRNGTYAEAYGEFNDSTWNGKNYYDGDVKIGLMGTFNGLGYAIKDMEMGSQREGFFGIVKGTVKNLAFLDVKSEGKWKTVLANYLIGATIENVYIRTDAYETDSETGAVTSKGFSIGSSAALANFACDNTVMKSCVIEYLTCSTVGSTPGGVLFYNVQETKNEEGAVTGVPYTFEDVYCVTLNKMGSREHTLVFEEKITDGKGCVILLAENDTSPNIPSNTTQYPRYQVSGVYRYNAFEDLAAAGYDFASLTASGCWEVVDNLPVWITKQ